MLESTGYIEHREAESITAKSTTLYQLSYVVLMYKIEEKECRQLREREREREIIHTNSSHLCLASHKRDIGKQSRPRSDAAECGV